MGYYFLGEFKMARRNLERCAPRPAGPCMESVIMPCCARSLIKSEPKNEQAAVFHSLVRKRVWAGAQRMPVYACLCGLMGVAVVLV